MSVGRRGHAAMLMAGSLLASALNLFAFVVFPMWSGTVGLEQFVRDNYVGGMYLFGIGSSIAPIGVFIFHGGAGPALKRYLMISAGAFILALSVCVFMPRPVASISCLLGAACMHAAGFFLAALMHGERAFAVSLLKLVQPLMFAAALVLDRYELIPSKPWAYWYLLACVAGVLVFALTVRWHALVQSLRAPPTLATDWAGLTQRMGMSVSMPLFFQLELIIIGHFTSLNVAVYAILQKLYSSVSTSLFGSLSVLMTMARLKRGEPAQRGGGLLPELFLSAACAVIVLGVGFGLTQTHQGHLLQPEMISLAALVSGLFSMASFIAMRITAITPRRGMMALVIAMVAYGAVLTIWKPTSEVAFLALAGMVFGMIIVITWPRASSSD